MPESDNVAAASEIEVSGDDPVPDVVPWNTIDPVPAVALRAPGPLTGISNVRLDDTPVPCRVSVSPVGMLICPVESRLMLPGTLMDRELLILTLPVPLTLTDAGRSDPPVTVTLPLRIRLPPLRLNVGVAP